MDPKAFVSCDNGTLQSVLCLNGLEFNALTQGCEAPKQHSHRKRSSKLVF
jgi:hypothetical protein